MTLRLAFLDGSGRLRRRALAGEVSLGRAPENDVRLAARNVSRRHARLTDLDGALWLEDLGSRNGTFVNGAPVRGRVRVAPGDEVRLADEALRLEESDPEETLDLAPPAATPPPLPGHRTPRPGAAPAEGGTATTALPAAHPAPAPQRARGWRAALAALRSLARRRA